MNAENILGICVLTNRARDLVTAENEWVSQSQNRVGSRIVLKVKASRFNLHLYLTGIEITIPLYLRATCTMQAKICLSAFGGCQWGVPLVSKQSEKSLLVSKQ